MAAQRIVLANPVTVSRYELTLTPDLDKFTFDGVVTLFFEVKEATATLRLHARSLTMQSIEARQGDKTNKASSYSLDLKNHVLEITFGEPLAPGAAVVSISYTGELNNQLAGFYRCAYTNARGEKKMMATTQFEPLDARRALPCIDEPAEKAVFAVTMVVPEHLTALSNMPETVTTFLGKGLKKVSFLDTPKMSTYLLAFIVGEFDFVQTRTDHGVMMRVYTPPGKAHLGQFALECGKKSLDFFDDFFGIPYPLPKIDMIAIPEFAMGAMENWGLVTYREVDSLIDPATASPQQQQRVCTVVAHELAHQWFGNLVTMAWWDDLWLNEGFATFMQNLAADSIFPAWLLWEQFGVDVLPMALALDGLRSSHPIQVPIARAEDVNEVFDAISYRKGASVIRMLFTVLGPDAFRAGLRLYMDRHKYSNTETVDLWAAWSEVSKRPIDQLMQSWTTQMGYPVLSVSETPTTTTSTHAQAASEGDSNTPTHAHVIELAVEQQWYLADGSEGDARTWTIPLPISTGRTHPMLPDTSGLLDAPPAIPPPPSAPGPASNVNFYQGKSFHVKVSLPTSPIDSWVKLNANQCVPLRVRYSDALLARLAAGVRAKTLPPADRAGLLLDTLALVRSGHYTPSTLQLLAAYRAEDNPNVWTALSMVILALDKVLLGVSAAGYSQFRAFIESLVTPALDTIGWDARGSDGHLDRIMRSTVVALVGRFSRRAADRAEAQRRFKVYCADPLGPAGAAACPTEYRQTVLQVGLREGGAEEYASLMAAYAQLTSDADRKHVMFALGHTPDATLRLKAMEWAISGAVKLQDYFYTLQSVAGASAEGLGAAWDFYKTNFQRLVTMTTGTPSLMAAAIVACCGGFTTTARADEVEKFFNDHPLPANAKRLQQVLESIRVSASFATRITQGGAAAPEFWTLAATA